MGIIITTEPIDVDVNGVVFWMQGDPTAGKEWDTLCTIKVGYIGKKRDETRPKIIEALAALANTPEDADIIRGLTDGTPTLENVVVGYIQAVTGFPTQPQSPSTKGSRRTGGT